jgi:two-component system, chemotaxis family, sensor kinase CheA
MAMDELTREFLIESQEGLDRMERCLTDLEQKPQDVALIGEIFRSVHTIKGTTGFLGFKRLEKLAHSGENLLGLLREGKISADRPIITGLLQLLDGLRSILKSIETVDGEGDGQDDQLIRSLAELQAPKALQPLAERPVQSQTHSQAKKKTHLKASVRVTAAHSSVSEVTAVGLLPIEAPPIPRSPSRATPTPTLTLASTPAEQPSAPAAASPSGAAPEPESGAAPARTLIPAAATAAESTLRVDVTLLNRMMNLVGELVLTRNQVLQATASDPNMTMLSRRLDMVTADLRENVMKARMQPVSSIFSKMPRIVRDLSQSLGRRVRLQVAGQETELDKSLLEAIKDPLTHAVRNSLDHGIEPPEVRQAAGKDPEGILLLRASHEGSHVVIEVSDDGAGIAVEKVRQKAIERGLIPADRAAHLDERELLQLIFLPGFSTAAAVTNVSGRGVGMDVVRTNVEKIGGKVEIDSRPGKGSTLRMRIPLTLAIIPALIVRSVGQSFALPQGSLSELVHVPPEQAAKTIEWIEGSPLYRLRGKLLPLVFLDRLLMPGGPHKAPTEQDNFIAVLTADGRQFGLVVDGLADPEEIVVKPLNAVLKSIALYSGATVLGNAELALILDPGAIALKAGVSMSANEKAEQAAESEFESEKASVLEYLLVEVAGRRAAVPLKDVLRIEQLPLSRIEYIGCRTVLNFEGQLLPVEDSGGILAEAAGSSSDSNAQIIVVVCREGNRQVGIAVSHVLDVAAGGDLFEAGTSQQMGGVTLLKERVTGVVDLVGVPPLPVVEIVPSEWEEAVR